MSQPPKAQPSHQFYASNDRDSLIANHGRVITESEMSNLLKANKHFLSEAYVKQLNLKEAYYLSKNRTNTLIAVSPSGNAKSFSYEELKSILRQSYAHQPLDEKFIAAVPDLVKELSEKLAIPLAHLDSSMESLHKVDTAFRKAYYQDKESVLERNILLPLGAYLGQVMIKETDGYWKVEREDTGYEKSKVLIVGQDGKTYDPIIPLASELGVLSEWSVENYFRVFALARALLYPTELKSVDYDQIPPEMLHRPLTPPSKNEPE
ncbi:hypothetical protein [Tunicatimonas pelagia]|uniref:hypothetical protein n=1 Tax=Tunicatimonas pelagia TaxID=931531 RepID=UPI002665C7B6|nr:hypothetical protein [Tunicatimonas pelagia]WKN44223.1 hypothetical protein P0M28_04480 [Tunicatimonas pelagia]